MVESLRSPEALREWADAQGVAVTLHPAAQPMPTVEAAAAALGIPTDAMTKNVVFLVAGQPVLVIARGVGRVDRRLLAQHFGIGQKKVKLATPEQTWEATGFVAGCVPPFGHREPLTTFIDETVLGLERVYGGTSEPTVLLSVPPAGLLALTGGMVLAVGE